MDASNLGHFGLADAEDPHSDVMHRTHEDLYAHLHQFRQSKMLARIGHAVDSAHGVGMNALNVAPMIRAIQAKTGWKQAQVAERLGVVQSQISRWLGGAKVDFDAGIAVRQLAIDVGALTNEAGTSRFTHVVPLRWRLGVAGVVSCSDDASLMPMATLSIPVPLNCFGLEVLANGVTARGKKGDLLIVGPSTDDVSHLIGVEALVSLADGSQVFGTLVSSTVPGAHGVVGAHGELRPDVVVSSAAPYCATFAAGQWHRADTDT